MRLYSLRSMILCSLALVASAFLFAFPASAGTVDRDLRAYHVYTLHQDIATAIHDLSAAMDKMAIQREAAAFLNSDPVPTIGARGGQRSPFDLKPEYAESYATDGLNFIDLRRRC